MLSQTAAAIQPTNPPVCNVKVQEGRQLHHGSARASAPEWRACMRCVRITFKAESCRAGILGERYGLRIQRETC